MCLIYIFFLFYLFILRDANELDTDVIMRSVGFAHRVWMNEPAKRAAAVEARGGSFEELYPYVSGKAARAMYESGDLAAGTISCSQGIGLVRTIKPVREILVELCEGAARIHSALGASVG